MGIFVHGGFQLLASSMLAEEDARGKQDKNERTEGKLHGVFQLNCKFIFKK